MFLLVTERQAGNLFTFVVQPRLNTFLADQAEVIKDNGRDVIDMVQPFGGQIHANGELTVLIGQITAVGGQRVNHATRLQQAVQTALAFKTNNPRQIAQRFFDIVWLDAGHRKIQRQNTGIFQRFDIDTRLQLLRSVRRLADGQVGSDPGRHRGKGGGNPRLQRGQRLFAVDHQAHIGGDIILIVELLE